MHDKQISVTENNQEYNRQFGFQFLKRFSLFLQVSVRSIDYTELLVIQEKDLRRVLMDFPEVVDRMTRLLRPHIGLHLLRRHDLRSGSRPLLREHVRLWARMNAMREMLLEQVQRGTLS